MSMRIGISAGCFDISIRNRIHLGAILSPEPYMRMGSVFKQYSYSYACKHRISKLRISDFMLQIVELPKGSYVVPFWVCYGF